jgi:hypothetical protein
VVLAYAVIWALRRFFAAGEDSLLRYIRVLLYVLIGFFVIAVFVTGFGRMLMAFENLRAGNTGDVRLGTTYIFLVLRYGVDSLPHGLNIWVVFAALKLLAALGTEPHSQESVAAARNMSRVCAAVLAATVLTMMAFNIGQLIFARRLHVVHIEILLPLVPILFVLGAFLFARYMARGKELKDENEGFV